MRQLLGMVLCVASPAVAMQPESAITNVVAKAGVTGGTVNRLALPDGSRWEALSVPVVIAGVRRDLELRPHAIRSPDFRLDVVDDGSISTVAAPGETTYRGTVRGIPGSSVSATLIPRPRGPELRAMVLLPGDETQWIEPLFDAGEGSHLVYARPQVRLVENARCGCVDGPHGLPHEVEAVPPGAGVSDALLVCELGIDTDFEYYQKNSSSVAATVNDISNVINNVALIYQTDANVTYQITHFIIRTSGAGQPYTSLDPPTLANQVATQWGAVNSGVRRDLAHLFTGKVMNGNIVGWAYYNGVCSASVGYGVSSSKYTNNQSLRTTLTAHELGHNFNVQVHCDSACSPCTIMCSIIGGCGGPLTNFGCNTQAIKEYAITRVCLNDANTAPSPVALPFEDSFPAALDTKKWTGNFGGQTSAGGVNERTPPLSLNLDSSDSIASVWIDTLSSGVAPVYVSFFAQQVNVPAGQSLLVECYNPTTHIFEPLASVVSDGAAAAHFKFHEAALPSSGLSATRSRLRFSTAGASANEDWYVDDVRVGVHCRADINKDHSMDISDFIDYQTSFAIGDVLVADFTDDLVLDIDDFIAYQTFYAIGCY